METGQRRFARYGVPGLIAHAAPCRRDRITTHSFQTLNPLCRGEPLPTPVILDTAPIAGGLKQLQPMELQQVRRTGDEPLFNSSDGGASLPEVRTTSGRAPEVSGLGAGPSDRLPGMVEFAPRHLGARTAISAGSAKTRRRNIRFIAYNTRFLILPWVAVTHLASHILGRMAAGILRRLATDVPAPDLFRGDLRRSGAFSRDLLSCGELGAAGTHDGTR